MDSEVRMTDTTRTVLIALGVSLLAVVLVPLLVCVGGMAAGGPDMNSMMGNAGGMGRTGGMMTGSTPWVMGSLVLVVLVAGVVSLVAGLRRR
jgi:hypothetical protein